MKNERRRARRRLYGLIGALLALSGTGCGAERDTADEACAPDALARGVDDSCGVFVRAAGDDAAAGTKDAPLATLAAAIAAAQRRGAGRVYACAESFVGPVEVPGGITIHGGLDCARDWAWQAGRRTTVTAAPGEIPVRLRGGSGTARLEDLEVVAPSIDATARPDLVGTSSVAAMAEGIAVELVRTSLAEDPAHDGAAGMSAAAQELP